MLEKSGEKLRKIGEGFSFLVSKLVSIFQGRRPGKTRNFSNHEDVAEDDGSSVNDYSANGASVLKNSVSSLLEKTDFLADRLFSRFPQEKRRSMLVASGGLFALLLILLVTLLIASVSGPKKDAVADINSGPRIPLEELFLPEEPDFLPEYLLEKEPKSSWTVEEIRPYWNDPQVSAPANPKIWQEEVKSAVDKLMEAVP